MYNQRRSLNLSKKNMISDPINNRNKKLAFIPKPSEYQYTSPTREPETHGTNDRKIYANPPPITTKNNTADINNSIPITPVGVSKRQ